MNRPLTDKEEAYVENLAAIAGRLAAVVEWCVNHDGETLADNRAQLSIAREALADARKIYDAAE
jgi:hypothetical protein